MKIQWVPICKVLGRVPVSTTEVLEFLLYIVRKDYRKGDRKENGISEWEETIFMGAGSVASRIALTKMLTLSAVKPMNVLGYLVKGTLQVRLRYGL